MAGTPAPRAGTEGLYPCFRPVWTLRNPKYPRQRGETDWLMSPDLVNQVYPRQRGETISSIGDL